MNILQVIFWVGIFLISYTYLLFPLVLHLLSKIRSAPAKGQDARINADPPLISVLIAAYNEEEVIADKIRSVLDSDYPREQIEILVGSDASTDGTDGILEKLRESEQAVQAVLFSQRTGKPGIINHLAQEARGEILVITDANVMLAKNTLSLLAGSFAEPRTGLVDTNMMNTRLDKEGISHQEKFYISREVRIKYLESILWGSMMGPFGGCYAVRKELYRPVPGHFLVDDFFINMSVLQQGSWCISNPEAKVYEDVSNDIAEEFRRKKRISAGNFQNLAAFRSLLVSRQSGVAFCFLSHKVIRWMVPFIVLLTLGSSLILGMQSLFYLILALAHLGIFTLPLIDHFLRKLGFHHIPLRFVSHFVLMNLALLAGFFKYAGGIKNNVWQPTRRNQGAAQ